MPRKLLLPIGLALLAAFCWTAVSFYRAARSPETAVERERSAPWILGPPARSLDDAAVRRVQAGLGMLNNPSLEPGERVRGYRVELRQAERLLLESLRRNPAQAGALSRLAAVRWELAPPTSDEQDRTLIALIELSSRMAPRVSVVQRRLGLVLLKMGREDDALGYFRRALKLDPGLAPEVVELLVDNAVPARSMLEALPRDGETLFALRGRLREPDDLKAFLEVVEGSLGDGNWRTIAAYGWACLRGGDPARLLATLDGLGPYEDALLEAERLMQRSEAHFDLGNRQTGFRDATAARDLQPNSIRYVRHLGTYALKAGMGNEAVAALNEALRLHIGLPVDNTAGRARYYSLIGQAEELEGRADRAYDAYRKALRIDPEEPVAARRLAEMESAAGMSGNAE